MRRHHRLFAVIVLMLAAISPASGWAQGGPPRITTNSLPAGAVGAPYSFTMTRAGGLAPYNWTATGLPAGLSIAPLTGVISGTPVTGGSFDVRVTLRDVRLDSDSEDFTLVISSFSISTASLPNGFVNEPYQQTLATTGGATPVTWSLQSGTLPAGLALSPSGTISGTPTTVGSSNVTIRAQDSDSRTADKAFSISITPRPLEITTVTLPNGFVGAEYLATLAASGGTEPYTWAVSGGSLPAGLTLSSSGTLSGVATAGGPAEVTIQVRDSSAAPQTASRVYTFRIDAALTVVSGPALPGGVVDQPYSFQLVASGGVTPYSWSLESGLLPTGLTINLAGAISGTPRANGTFPFTIAVTDSRSPAQTTTREVSITIGSPISIVTQSPLGNGAVGVPYTATLVGSGGTAPLTWSVTSGQLPAGLTLSETGTISGTPLAAGSSTFTIEVRDNSNQTASRAFTFNIQVPLMITTTSPLPSSTAGMPYSLQLQATLSGPLVWALVSGTLPPGIALSPAGVISGTATSAGSSTFTVEVQGGSPPQTARQTLRLDVLNPVSISTSTLPAGTVGSAFAASLSASGGTPPYSWSVTSGSLPPGLALSGAGLLSGTPTQAGMFNFSVRVQDNAGGSATTALSAAISAVGSGSLTLSGMPAIMTPTQQAPLALAVASAAGTPLAGTLTMTFQPNAAVGGDDPMVLLSNGSRSVRFNIPANSTTAIFPSQTLLATGTVAGMINFTAAIDGSPGAVQVGSILIQPLPPQFAGVEARRSSGNLRVQVTGYSSERRVSIVEFTFDVRVAGSLERVILTRNVESEFDNWYRNPASAPFGSAFQFVQNFAVAGDVQTIESVTVRLANGQGIGVSPQTGVGN